MFNKTHDILEYGKENAFLSNNGITGCFRILKRMPKPECTVKL